MAGGIPVIKALTEGLAGNRMRRVMGVMNGTCNYILTRMEDTGLPYDTVFEEARQLGYLEADPDLDVGGIDAGHKLAILASIAFGTRISFDAVRLEGIGRVSIDDIRHAGDMGYKIKLLGVAQMTGRGLEQRMTPCLVPASSPLGQLSGGTNMIVLEGDSVGPIVLRGAGAGEGPTASAVMGDVMDVARGLRLPAFGQLQPAWPRHRRPSPRSPRPITCASTGRQAGGACQVATVLGETACRSAGCANMAMPTVGPGADRDTQDNARCDRHCAGHPARDPRWSTVPRSQSASRRCDRMAMLSHVFGSYPGF